MNKMAHIMSDTYWCPYCYVDFKYFVLINLDQFEPGKQEHIKQVVKKFLQEHRGYFRNIKEY
jgi:hypothetical protein